MAKANDPKNPKNKVQPIRRDPRQTNSTRDPEFEIPDPEQIERDIEEAEELYRKQERKKA
jgi:hypothetical protein